MIMLLYFWYLELCYNITHSSLFIQRTLNNYQISSVRVLLLKKKDNKTQNYCMHCKLCKYCGIVIFPGKAERTFSTFVIIVHLITLRCIFWQITPSTPCSIFYFDQVNYAPRIGVGILITLWNIHHSHSHSNKYLHLSRKWKWKLLTVLNERLLPRERDLEWPPEPGREFELLSMKEDMCVEQRMRTKYCFLVPMNC